MKPFGDLLREAREERGVTLEDIAGETRIARRFLDALEASDVEALPGGPFNKGYIRSYAQHLGIDPQPFLAAYDREARTRLKPQSDEEMLAELSRLAEQNFPQRPRLSHLGGIGVVLSVAALALLLFLSWYFLGDTTPSEESPPATVATALPPEPPSKNENTNPPLASESTADTSPHEGVIERPPPGPTTVNHPQQTEATTELAPSTSPPSDEEQAGPEEPVNTDHALNTRLTVSGYGVGTGVVEHSLVGKGDRFPEGTHVWFWTRVLGGESGDMLRHYWLYEGRTVRLFELSVGGPHWRTHSNYMIPSGSTGSYAVEARGPDGRVLARQEFQCFPKQNAQVQR